MKKISKIISLTLALILMLSLSLTVFAATSLKNGTLTVTGAQLEGKTVTAVRMFTANVDDKNNNGMIDDGDIVSYEMEPAWQGFFDQLLAKTQNQHAASEEAYAYVKNLTPEAKLVEFAKAAKKYYNENSGSFTSLQNAQTGDSNNTATFTNLVTGYYLVLPANGSTATNRATDAMIVNVPGQKAAHLELKTEYPSVVKTVTPQGGHGNSAQIGGKVSFTLTSKVPNMEDYTTYVFNFKDTLSKGLTLDENSIQVTIGGTPVEKTGNYEVVVTSKGEAGTLLEIKFTDLKKVSGISAGDPIKVTYTATLNDKALTGTNPNTNKAEVEYSNDPSNNGTGTSEPSITNTYTFEIKIHKYANTDEVTLLPGAEFQLQTSPDGTIIKLVKVNDTEYRVATPEEITAQDKNLVETFLTVDTGDIVIKGMKAGSYQLAEINAPVGYNKLTKPVVIEIREDYEQDGTLKTGFPQYVVNSGTPSTENVIKVQNKNGAFLPETGSIGTIGLTIAGVALVVGGIGFTSRKKKEQA